MTTADDIKAFCANLERSLISCLEQGQPIHFEQKIDQEPVYAGWAGQFAVPADYAYMGETRIIRVGRPAQERIDVENWERRQLLSRLTGSRQ